MKVALASKRFINNNINHNLDEITSAMWEAKLKGAELICFGESFLQGFDSLKWNYSEDIKTAVSINSDAVYRICYASLEYGIDVMLGYIESDGDKLYSSCMLIEKGRIIYNYRRISRGWKEYEITDGHYSEGVVPAVFEYKGIKCMIALCGDLWEYQEKFKLGEKVLFWPIYVNFSKEQWNDRLKKEYIEHSGSIAVKVLIINSLSDNPSAYGGCMYICNGILEKELEMGKDGLLICDI